MQAAQHHALGIWARFTKQLTQRAGKSTNLNIQIQLRNISILKKMRLMPAL